MNSLKNIPISFFNIIKGLLSRNTNIKNIIIIFFLAVIVVTLYRFSFDTSAIATVCISITVSIMGIAFPIIVNNITNIGRQYSSIYLKKIFDRKNYLRSSLTSLIFSLISIVFILFKLKHLFLTNIKAFDYIICNSAYMFCAICTIFLVISFIRLLNILYLFNSQPIELVNFLSKEFKKTLYKTEKENYYLKAINEFAVYSVEEHDSYLQQVLLKFYDTKLSIVIHNASPDIAKIYTEYLYRAAYDVVLFKSHSEKDMGLLPLEEKVIDGSLFFIENLNNKGTPTSETYQYLWMITMLIIKHDSYVKKYWQIAYTYANLTLKINESDEQIFNTTLENNSNDELFIQKRDFMIHHMAVGGFLIYKKRIALIKYLFSYTAGEFQLSPLLLNTIDGIFGSFNWFFQFVNYDHYNKFYKFEITDNTNLSPVDFILKYIVLLYIRYLIFYEMNPDLFTYYYGHSVQNYPSLPTKPYLLTNWSKMLKHMEETALQVIEDKDLLLSVIEQSDNEINMLDHIKEVVGKNLQQIKEKVDGTLAQQIKTTNNPKDFNNYNFTIINESLTNAVKLAFKDNFNYLLQDKPNIEESTSISKTLFFAPPFYIENSIHSLDVTNKEYYTSMCSDIITKSVDRLIGKLFIQETTAHYLLSSKDIPKAINKITNGRSGYKIIIFNDTNDLINLLESTPNTISKVKIAYDNKLNNAIFILHEDDLPFLKSDILNTKELIEKFRIKTSDDKFEPTKLNIDIDLKTQIVLYTLFDDYSINKSGIMKNNIKASIVFDTSICWKREKRNIARIDILTQVTEQGLENSLNDVIPFEQNNVTQNQ